MMTFSKSVVAAGLGSLACAGVIAATVLSQPSASNTAAEQQSTKSSTLEPLQVDTTSKLPGNVGVYYWPTPGNAWNKQTPNMLRALQKRGVSTSAVDVSYAVDISEIQNPTARKKEYERYIGSLLTYTKNASLHGIKTDFSIGTGLWVYPDRYYVFDIVNDFIVDFNKRSKNDVLAVHIDVEPWALTQWESQSKSLAKNYISMIDHIVRKRALPHKLTLVLPHWFDGTGLQNIQYAGKSDSTFNHLVRIMDKHPQSSRALIMSYATTLTGPTGVPAKIKTELAAVKGHKMGILIGQDVVPNTSEPETTYYSKSFKLLKNNVKELNNRYKGNQAFKGVFINGAEELSKLQ